MWPSESELESISSIIDGMNPIFKFPYPMKSSKNEGFPRNMGNPWIGKYSKNGYWYRISWAGNDEWEEISNEMWYRNEFLVDSKSFGIFRKISETLKLLVAKNIRGEVLGIALLVIDEKMDFSKIGPIFVKEEFRHVGIGSTLMKEVLNNQKNVVFNAISYLIPTIKNFNLTPKSMRTFRRIRVKNPSGFEDLKESLPGIFIKSGSEISDWTEIFEFLKKVTNEKRDWKKRIEDEGNGRVQFLAAFNESTNFNSCVGISILHEIQNNYGQVPDLLIAPLYCESSDIAEILLRKSLSKFYNPEDDFDFDVDYLAIYRRSVNFFVFEESESFFMPILRKLTGNEGILEKYRLDFQTCSNFQLPGISGNSIFAISDPNLYFS